MHGESSSSFDFLCGLYICMFEITIYFVLTICHIQVHHDMSAPLQHYFIYTGHNSYLTGNQLSSDCSEIPIVRALERGVRGIELDLWPNSAKDNIHVLHGRYNICSLIHSVIVFILFSLIKRR